MSVRVLLGLLDLLGLLGCGGGSRIDTGGEVSGVVRRSKILVLVLPSSSSILLSNTS